MGAMWRHALYFVPEAGGAPLETGLHQRKSVRFGPGGAGRPRRYPILAAGAWTALLFILTSPASFGAEYFFSSCATGGKGTKETPWCLDPNGDGTRESIMYLFDGTAPEAAAGDTISLCAGNCDGGGTATYHISPTHASPYYWFCPRVGGTIESPITIQNYSGEIVIISGDTNANGAYNSGVDVDSLINDACNDGTNPTDIHFVGHDVGGSKGLGFHYSGVNMIQLINGWEAGFTNGPNGWVFDGIDFRHVGASMWAGDGIYENCYNIYGMSPPSKLFYIFYLGRPASDGHSLVVQNSHISEVCGTVFRLINNVGRHSTMLVKNNVMENSMLIDASFSNWNTSDNTKYLAVTWEGNTIRDVVNGIEPKGGIRGWIVQDNAQICTGTKHLIDTSGRCNNAIIFQEDSANLGYTSDIVIQRNTVYSTSTSVGWSGGILFESECTAPNSYHSAPCVGNGPLVENNFIWNQKSPYPGQQLSAAIGLSSNIVSIVQNNTIVGGNGGIWYDTSDTSIAPIIRNNLVYDVDSTKSLGLLHLKGGIEMSAIGYNNLNTTSGTSLVQIDASAYSCSQLNAGSAQIPATNKCATPLLVNYSGAPSTWDLHLAPGDTADKDAGTAGPSDDIDKQPRTGNVDIGADETTTSSDTVPPATVQNLRFL